MAETLPDPIVLLQLLWRVDHALGTLSRQMLAHLGVTSPQRLALRALRRAPGTNAAGLAEMLRVDKSSVAGVVARLEDAGLIVREPDESDARKQRLRVTEEGTRLDDLRHGTVEAALGRTLTAMEPCEVEVVTTFLTAFAAELERERILLVEPAT